MRTPLDKTLRGKLEKTVEKARDIVEVAVTEALTRLGIGEGNAPNYLSEVERKLRTRLRAHGRQLGDVLNRDSGKQETELLVNEMAYEHWHRMLFARFLEQSDLLMYDQYTQVTLKECFELAEEEPDIKDGWELAGQLAQKMLPQIFRADSPVFDVKLSINHVQALEELIANLHPDTFQASDALGWCYQFWQNKKKKQVNESGVKIGAKELSPVTQLFTEPYMVSFLLDNALGAWWAKRRLTQDDLATATSEQELRELASIPGVPLEYLRFVQNEDTGVDSENKVNRWSCAAGDFDKWPDDLNEFKTLDPCCGSGHFLVAKFLMLVPIRMDLEGLTAKEAIDKVLAQNIHGLELDQRCIELAAFALALEAWRYPGAAGYRQLPELQLACSGMSITEAQKEWKDLAKDDEELQGAIKWMQQTFKDAPTLGSLIDPKKVLKEGQPLPWMVLEKRLIDKADKGSEAQTIVQGLAKTAELLVENYDWVVTNVPYLTRKKMNDKLTSFCDSNYLHSKQDLANVFLDRCIHFSKNGFMQSVMPQNWLFLKDYRHQRASLLTNQKLVQLIRLGSGAFDTISGENVKAILVGFDNNIPTESHSPWGIDISMFRGVCDKSNALTKELGVNLPQKSLYLNPMHVIALEDLTSDSYLAEYAESFAGVCTGDYPRFGRNYWEILNKGGVWEFQSSTVSVSKHWGGLSKVLLWENGQGSLYKFVSQRLGEKNVGSWLRGNTAWNRRGISVKLMTKLPVSAFGGNKFDDNVAVLQPKNEKHLLAIQCYCESEDFSKDVRKVNDKLAVPLCQDSCRL